MIHPENSDVSCRVTQPALRANRALRDGLKLLVCAAGVFLVAASSNAQTLKVSLKTQPKAGDKIIALVEAAGDVGVETDVAQASFVAKGNGLREIDLGQGNVARIGFYWARFSAGGKQTSLLIPILSDMVAVPSPPPAALSAPEQRLLAKFFSACRAHGTAYFHTWPARQTVVENVVKIATAGTLVVVCATEPTKFTCIPAAAATTDVAVEAVFDFTKHALDEMEKDGSLTPAETATMRTLLTTIKASRIALSVALGSGVAERVVEGMETFSIILEEKSNLRLTIGLQKDVAGQTIKLLEVLHK